MKTINLGPNQIQLLLMYLQFCYMSHPNRKGALNLSNFIQHQLNQESLFNQEGFCEPTNHSPDQSGSPSKEA